MLLARAATRNATREAAEKFSNAALWMQKAVIKDNVLSFLEADKSLDEALALGADNAFASRLAAPLQTHSRRFWFRYQAETGLAEAADRHLSMVRAIMAGDEEKAGQEADRLMLTLRRRAEEALRR